MTVVEPRIRRTLLDEDGVITQTDLVRDRTLSSPLFLILFAPDRASCRDFPALGYTFPVGLNSQFTALEG